MIVFSTMFNLSKSKSGSRAGTGGTGCGAQAACPSWRLGVLVLETALSLLILERLPDCRACRCGICRLDCRGCYSHTPPGGVG